MVEGFMKKFILTIIFLMLLAPVALFAGGSNNYCQTKYPVVFAHGMAFTDGALGIDYWWDIIDDLEDNGADVYVAAVNSMDSTVAKALQFRQQFLEFLAVSGTSKANIIGHSHGGLYTRYAISNLGLASKVASLTTICSPHRGSAVADVVIGVLPDAGEWLVGSICDIVYRFLIGDENPNSLDNAYDLARSYMTNVFNPNTPNASGVYYQSYATKIYTITADMVLEGTWMLLNFYEGANDGLVSVSSAQWGNFRGTWTGSWYNMGGVSHINAINHFFGMTPGADVEEWYVDIVNDLKVRGL
jgi:triacylglycerol lipase